jgi:hypothetical protein
MYVADGQVFGKAKHVQAVQEEGSHNSATNTWQPMFRVHDYKQAQTTTPDVRKASQPAHLLYLLVQAGPDLVGVWARLDEAISLPPLSCDLQTQAAAAAAGGSDLLCRAVLRSHPTT